MQGYPFPLVSPLQPSFSSFFLFFIFLLSSLLFSALFSLLLLSLPFLSSLLFFTLSSSPLLYPLLCPLLTSPFTSSSSSPSDPFYSSFTDSLLPFPSYSLPYHPVLSFQLFSSTLRSYLFLYSSPPFITIPSFTLHSPTPIISPLCSYPIPFSHLPSPLLYSSLLSLLFLFPLSSSPLLSFPLCLAYFLYALLDFILSHSI